MAKTTSCNPAPGQSLPVNQQSNQGNDNPNEGVPGPTGPVANSAQSPIQQPHMSYPGRSSQSRGSIVVGTKGLLLFLGLPLLIVIFLIVFLVRKVHVKRSHVKRDKNTFGQELNKEEKNENNKANKGQSYKENTNENIRNSQSLGQSSYAEQGVSTFQAISQTQAASQTPHQTVLEEVPTHETPELREIKELITLGMNYLDSGQIREANSIYSKIYKLYENCDPSTKNVLKPVILDYYRLLSSKNNN